MLKSATLAVPGALALSALGGFNQAAPAQAATGQWWNDPGLIPPASQTFFSVFISDSESDHKAREAAVESALGAGRKLRATNVYWNNGNLGAPNASSGVARAQQRLTEGMVPRLAWSINRAAEEVGFTNANMGGRSLWKAVADGFFDVGQTGPNGKWMSGINQVFTDIKNLTFASPLTSNKIFFTLCHEPELSGEGGGFNGGSSGTEAEFRAAWQHCHNVAATVGATNIRWVLSFAANTSARWGTALTATGSDGLYPGHNYVDWIGWDPYNRYRFFNSDGTQTADWFDMTKLITRTIGSNPSLIDWWYSHFAVQGSTSGLPYKPVMLCETGTSDLVSGLPPRDIRSIDNGDINAKNWMLGLRYALANSPRAGIATLSQVVRGVIYFSKNYESAERPTNVNWSLEENKDSPTSKWAALSQLSPQGDWLFNW